MAKKILVAYSTNAGSTAEVAKTIGEEIGKSGAEVDVRSVGEVQDVSTYDAVVIGVPMILGWHKKGMNFLETNKTALSQKPVAFFIMSLGLTKIAGDSFESIPVYQDPSYGALPKVEGKLSFAEKSTSVANYLGTPLQKVPEVKPVSVGIFAGKLDFSRLNLFGKLFVKIIIRHPEGDFRNWDAIREWAADLSQKL